MQDEEKTFFADMRIHLVGIGGVSMSALGEVLHSRGLRITGSDWQQSEATDKLKAKGIPIYIGEDPANIGQAQLVIRTAAAQDSNAEIAEARKRGIHVMERAEAWGQIMKEYANALCISGTHGKTTTTAMATHIALAADADPTVMLGGSLALLNAGHRIGHGDLIIMESCEYCNSFLKFFPTIAVILNIEEDHLDFFKDINEVISSFQRFAELTPHEGHVIINSDDTGAREAARGLDRDIIRFGWNEHGGIHPENVMSERGCFRFDVYNGHEFYTNIELLVPGRHNVTNALAAAAAAKVLGFSGLSVSDGLKTFHGAARRMEYKGSFGEIPVFDDYAHHPTEIKATLEAVREMGYDRILCVFQPHTYSRTKALFNDFVTVLSEADLVFLGDIYAAREKNTFGISSKDLSERIPRSRYASGFSELADAVRSAAHPGDIVLTMGAGDIYKVGEILVQQNLNNFK